MMNETKKIGVGIAAALAAVPVAFPQQAHAITYLPEETMATLEEVLPVASLPVTTCLLLVAFAPASYIMGWKNALKFFIPGYIIAWIFEDLSVHTGIVFGFYYFPEMMSPQLDVIPFEIPMFWLLCFYCSWYVTNLILDGKPIPTDHSVKRIIGGALVGGFVLTAMDLTTDPFATANGFWIWPYGGTFFNEPVHNFIGWYVTGAITLVIHGFIFRRDLTKEPIALSTKGKRILTCAFVLLYLVESVMFSLMNVHESLGVPTFLAMGLPAVAATYKWLVWYFDGRREAKELKA